MATRSEVHRHYAYGLQRVGHFASAVLHYKRSLAMAENLAAMLQLATLYGDDEWFLTALSAFGESDDMFLLWSACALTRGDFDIAESKLMQMSAVAQTSRDWLYLRAMVLFERRQLRAAESAFKLLLRRYPSF